MFSFDLSNKMEIDMIFESVHALLFVSAKDATVIFGALKEKRGGMKMRTCQL